MLSNKTSISHWVRGAAAALALLAGAFGAAPAQAADHRGFARKHPIITGAAAVAVVHHYRHRSPRRTHRSFVRRHPIITGVAAATAVHHYRKHHR